MKHFIKSRLARKAAEKSSQGSAAAAGRLPSASVANSAGASTQMAEICRTLDPLLNHLSDEELLSIGEENVANRLQRLCEKYYQSGIPADLEAWTYDQETLDMVRLAVDCAEAVYKHSPKVTVSGVTLDDGEFTDTYEIHSSHFGGYKATMIKIHQRSKTLVVSVRGTRKTSPVDWITNANGAPEDATDFLPGIPTVKAHSGFLFAAKTMADAIISAIKNCQAEFRMVLLTGHSAGGAVAALLFASFRLTGALGIPLHCITFGAPPVLSVAGIEASSMPSNTDAEASNTKFLAFAVHGDIVVRAERHYMRKILEIYGTASMDTLNTLADVQFSPPELYNAGKSVMLYDKNPDAEGVDIMAAEVGSVIGTLLWGKAKVHAMKVYCEMIAGL